MANYINPDRNIVVPGLDPVVNFASFKHRVEDIAAAKTLTVKDSGKVFMISQASCIRNYFTRRCTGRSWLVCNIYPRNC